MHYLAALISLAATLLFSERTGFLHGGGNESRWSMVTRVGLLLVLCTVALGFLDLAVHDGAFLVRHWLVGTAVSLTLAGHVGLLFQRRS